ncbi:MAG: hypothetical protein WAP52_04060 [Candidatus Sungiibacteriota bacterium]
MDFLLKIRDAVHGWSEETRKFLAMVTMGIGLLAFFSLWVSSVSSRLVAIGPSAPAAPTTGTPAAAALAVPIAFAPSRDNFGSEDTADLPPSAPPAEQIVQNPAGQPYAPILAQEPIAAPLAPTPLQGVAETFAGLDQLFSRAADQPFDTIEGKLRGIGAWLWSVALNLFAWAQNFLQWFGGWLYSKVSMIIVS